MDTLTYIPVQQTAVEQGLWLQMQAKVEEIKKQMGDRYILAKPVEKIVNDIK